MKRGAPVVAAIVAFLEVVCGAEAKAPPNGMDVCGKSGCVHLAVEQSEQLWTGSREVGRPLRVPSPFYVLSYRWTSTGAEQRGYYVPAAKAIRLATEAGSHTPWVWLDGTATAAIDRAVSGLAPYDVSPPTAVMVGEKDARGPETYLRLLRGRSGGSASLGTMWISVTMRSDPPTPWTDGVSDIRLSAPGRSRLVLVDGWVHTVPWRLANLARRGLPLMP